MNKFRKWINRDDGKIFQVKNENLNSVEIAGYALLVFSFISNAVKNLGIVHMPKLAVIAVAAIALIVIFIGNYKKRKDAQDESNLDTNKN